MKISFENRTVLVTGGTRGIGRQMVIDYRKAGADVILTGSRPNWSADDEMKSAGSGRLEYLSADLTLKSEVGALIESIEKMGTIDVCVNNAGINRLNPIESTSMIDWEEMIRLNLEVPFRILRSVLPVMKRRSYGRVVNISSIFGHISREKRSIYTVTKSGLHGMTVTSAIECARHNVLINTVSPGFVLTDLTRKNLSPAEMADLAGKVPAGRLAEPEEISRVVLFLTSDLNSYIVGQNIFVDGGYVVT